jgi:hypothetical protein
MGAEESLISATGKVASRKLPVLGIAIGVAQTAKGGWNAKNARERARDTKQSEQKRIAATRAANIFARRAIFKAASTVVAQVPVCGTIAALALDGANTFLNAVDGNPKQLEKEASRNGPAKKKTTEAFMRSMREQAENAERGARIAQQQALRRRPDWIRIRFSLLNHS